VVYVSEDGMQRQSASTCAWFYLKGNLTSNIHRLSTSLIVLT